MLNKLWQFVKKHFLTKKFITFGVIGVVNTGIHLLIYNISYNNITSFVEWIYKLVSGTSGTVIIASASLAFVSNVIAFIVASVFSYFANAIFTFKPKNKNATQFTVVMGVYLTRLLISSLLTALFNYIALEWLLWDYILNPVLKSIPPFVASALLIPIAYFALDWVFKKTDRETVN